MPPIASQRSSLELCWVRSATVKVLVSDMIADKEENKWWGRKEEKRKRKRADPVPLVLSYLRSQSFAVIRGAHFPCGGFIRWRGLSAKVLVVDHIHDQEHKDQDDRRRNQLVRCHSTSPPPPPSKRGKGSKESSQFSPILSFHNHMPNHSTMSDNRRFPNFLPASHALQRARCLVNVRICLQKLLQSHWNHTTRQQDSPLDTFNRQLLVLS